MGLIHATDGSVSRFLGSETPCISFHLRHPGFQIEYTGASTFRVGNSAPGILDGGVRRNVS
jgi:hypothetical protein